MAVCCGINKALSLHFLLLKWFFIVKSIMNERASVVSLAQKHNAPYSDSCMVHFSHVTIFCVYIQWLNL